MLEFSLSGRGRPPQLHGSELGARLSSPGALCPRAAGVRCLHSIETYPSMLVLQCWFVANLGRIAMRHPGLLFSSALVGIGVSVPASVRAQTLTVNELKSKIFDAKIVEKTFAKGAPFCKELDGKNFYFETRNRVLNLDDYSKSLDNLVRDRAFNPEKKRPWNPEDAKVRMEVVHKMAAEDVVNCELIANRASYEKQLNELQKK
jgi:hypothetical protein